MLGEKSFSSLPKIIEGRKISGEESVIYIVDEFFEKNEVLELGLGKRDRVIFVKTSKKV